MASSSSSFLIQMTRLLAESTRSKFLEIDQVLPHPPLTVPFKPDDVIPSVGGLKTAHELGDRSLERSLCDIQLLVLMRLLAVPCCGGGARRTSTSMYMPVMNVGAAISLRNKESHKRGRLSPLKIL